MFNLGIDPGFKNLGMAFAVIHKDSRDVFKVVLDPKRTITKNLDISLDEAKDLNRIDQACKSLFWHTFPRADLLKRSLILCEEQYFNPMAPREKLWLSSRLCVLNQALLSILSSTYSCVVVNLGSNEMKAALQIKSTKGGDDTKAKAVALVKSLIPDNTFSQHVVDAIVLIYYNVVHHVFENVPNPFKETFRVEFSIAKEGEIDRFLEEYNKQEEEEAEGVLKETDPVNF